MIKLEKTEVVGWEAAIRGMRNPMNSWEKSDSVFDIDGYYDDENDEHYYGMNLKGNIVNLDTCDEMKYLNGNLDHTLVGPNDLDLMLRLNKGGPVEAKYRRMIVVYADITAPLYWWKEFDTYKVGTVANSCSTMHKIHAKKFTLEDFSCEHLYDFTPYAPEDVECPIDILKKTIKTLNYYRDCFLENKDKDKWWQMIQLLPTCYNQKRTVMLNYEVLAGIYPKRKNHKLDEWHTFCDWIKTLPLSEIIIGEEEK